MVGSGILNDPYLITNASDWSDINTYQGTRVYFKLENDIDFNGQLLTPHKNFMGYIDGNYKRLKYFKITTDTNAGLFDTINGDVVNYSIKNLEIYSGSLDTSNVIENFGFVAGIINSASISNVHVVQCKDFNGSGISLHTEFDFGFFGGKVVDSIIVSSSVRNSDFNMDNIINYDGSDSFGGFVGKVDNSIINTCYSDNRFYNILTTLVDTINIGGFVGYVTGSNSEILNCHASASLTTTSWDSVTKIGGFVGNVQGCELFENCYSNTYISTDANPVSYINGFVGYSVDDNYNNCFYNMDRVPSGFNTSYVEISGRSDKQSNSIVRLPDSEMKLLENYTEIDNYYLNFAGDQAIGFIRTGVLVDPYFDGNNLDSWAKELDAKETFEYVEPGTNGAYCVFFQPEVNSGIYLDLTSTMITGEYYIVKIRYKSTGHFTVEDYNGVIHKTFTPKGDWTYVEFRFRATSSKFIFIKFLEQYRLYWIDSFYVEMDRNVDFNSVELIDSNVYNKVLELNGNDEYLVAETQSDLAGLTASSLGNMTTAYCIVSYNQTDQLGSTSCIKIVANGAGSNYLRIYVDINKRYKVHIKYKSTNEVIAVGPPGNSASYKSLPRTTEWNVAQFTFGAVMTEVRFNFYADLVGCHIEYIKIYEDVKNELNSTTELIKHSKNRDFGTRAYPNITTNSGYSGTTDWVDTNSDGLADTYSDQYAIEFDGVDDYLQIALPTNILNGSTTNDFTSSGTRASGWVVGLGETWNDTSQIGMTGTYAIKISASSGYAAYQSLTVGKKYKLKIRYKSNATFRVGSSATGNNYANLGATNEWNTATVIFTATSVTIGFNLSGAGTIYIDTISIKEDQGFDLNKDQEQILHSKNADFERTLGAELNSGTVTIGSKYVVTAGTVEGNAIGTEFLATTTATTLDASNKVKPIPSLATGTFVNNGTYPFDTFTGASVQGFTAVESTTLGRAIAYRAFNFISGKRYRFSYTITINSTSFGVGLNLGASDIGAQTIAYHSAISTSTVTYDVTASSNHTYYGFRVEAGDSIDFVISNFHFYEIPEWTAAGNHTQNLSILDKSGATGQSMLISGSGAGRGSELISNGTFDSNTTGWSGDNNGVLAWESGRVKLSNGTAITGRLIQNITVESGKTYEIKFNFDKGNSVGGDLIINGSTVLVFYDTRDYRTTWTANATGAVQVRFRTGDGVAGNYVYYDSISIKEILGEVSLPYANIESCVAGKKYTIEGYAKLDPTSLTYGSNLLSGDGTGGWAAGYGTGAVVSGEYVLTSATSGYIVRQLVIDAGKDLKVVLKAKSATYTGALTVYHGSTDGWRQSPNLTSTYQTFTFYVKGYASENLFIQLASNHVGDVYLDDIQVYDAISPTITLQLGTKSITSTASSQVAGLFTKFVLNFEATAAEVNQDLKAYLSGAGSVFVDKLSLTQAYDCALLLSKKGVSANSDWFFALGYGSVGNIGYDIYQGSNGAIAFGVRTSTTQASTGIITGTTNQTWVDLIGVFNRTSATSSYIKSNKLGQTNTFDITDEGKVILNRLLTIATYSSGNADAFAGQLSYVQLVRFENISQSTFNSAITGLQYPIGGGAEEVLRLTFQDSSSLSNALKDYSPKNHTISSFGGMTLENIIRHYGLGRNPEIGFTLNGVDESLQINRYTELITSNADMNSVTNSFSWTTSGTVTFGDTAELDRLNGVCKIVGTSGQGIRKDSIVTVGKRYKLNMRYKSTVDINFGNSSTVTAYKVFKASSQWNTVEFSFNAVTNGNIVFYLAGTGTAWIDNISLIQDLKFDLNDYERVTHSKNSSADLTTIDCGSLALATEYALQFNGTDEFLYRSIPANADIGVNSSARDFTENSIGTWTTSGTVASNVTETGSSRTYVTRLTNTAYIEKTFTGVQTGSQYKFSLRYKSTSGITISDGTTTYLSLPSTTQWNSYQNVLIPTSSKVRFAGSATGTSDLDLFSMYKDWKLDLNSHKENIIHSKNRDFELTLGTELWTNTTFVDSDVDGLANGLEFYSVKSTETLAIDTDSDGLHQKIIGAGDTRILVKPTTLDNAKSYLFTFSYKSSNNFRVWIGGGSTLLTLPTSTVKRTISIQIYMSGLISNGIWIEINSNTMQLYSLSIREIPNILSNGTFGSSAGWALVNGTTVASNKMILSSSTSGTHAYFDSVGMVGRKHRVVYRISDYVTGSFYVKFGNISAIRSANGIYTDDIVATESRFSIVATSTINSASFDDIHISEIPEWTQSGNHTIEVSTIDKYAGTQSLKLISTGSGRGSELITNPTIAGSSTGWTITNTASVAYGNDNLVCTNLNNSSTLKPTGVTVTAGKIYEIIFTITATAGNIAFVAGVGAVGRTNKTVSGAYREIQTCANTGDFYVDGSGFYGTIESLYVKEYFGEATLPYVNIDPIVSGSKYTLEGWARLDPTSLTYGSNLFTSISHSATFTYETFTASGNAITSAINTSGYASAYINIGSVAVNEIVKATFNLTLNSGSAPRVVLMQSGEGLAGTNCSPDYIVSVTGSNAVYLRVLNTQSPNYLVIREPSGGGGATDFSISDIVINKSTVIAPSLTAQIGTKIVSSSALSVVPGTFTKFVSNFEASTSEVNQDLKLYLSNTGSVYVDNISITQAYDAIVTLNKKHSGTQPDTDYIVSLGSGGGGAGFNMHSLTSNRLRFTFSDSVSNTKSSDTLSNTPFTFVNVIGIINRTDNVVIYRDGGNSNGATTLSNIGKAINYKGLDVGTFAGGGADSFSGSLGSIQILRFTNISSSNFNPTTYKIGQRLTGGGNESVFHFDPSRDGTNITTVLQDWSGLNNHLSASSMDITNRIVTL